MSAAATAPAATEPPLPRNVREFTFAIPDASAAGAGDAAADAAPRCVRVAVAETDWASGGLGWRVWGAAHVLSRELCAPPMRALLARQRVLELGAGCGLCGFVAAALGAREVVLTDALPALLHTLAASAALQAGGAAAAPPSDAAGEAADAPPAAAGDDAAAWAWRGGASGSRVLVRTLLWDDDAGAAPDDDDAFKRSMLAGQLRRLGPEASATAPTLDAAAMFPLVIGSDLLYDWGQRAPLARVLRHRLAPGGLALLALPVRDKPLLDAFLLALGAEGLDWDARPSRHEAAPDACRAGAPADGTGGDEPLSCVDVRAWHAAAPPAQRWRGWPEDAEADA
jgi:predicted nicotinamide N-methyase